LRRCFAFGDRLYQKALDQANERHSSCRRNLRRGPICLEQVSLLGLSWAHDNLPLAGPIPRETRLEAHQGERAAHSADRRLAEGTW
jgi:hypothetical protein